MTKKSLFQEARSTSFVINLMPRQELLAHRHPGYDVNLFVFEGDGECTLDGVRHPLSWRDVIHCEGSQLLSVKNTGRKFMSVYVVLAGK
ncbi:MAG TPA: cupin domain-containing protein [Bacillales bacterium]